MAYAHGNAAFELAVHQLGHDGPPALHDGVVGQQLDRARARVHGQLDQGRIGAVVGDRSEEHTSELQSPCNLVCRLLLEKKTNTQISPPSYTMPSGALPSYPTSLITQELFDYNGSTVDVSPYRNSSMYTCSSPA